ncbi:MAG: RNA polymerase sigma-70 factor (ECF subfamily) [Rhodothermales bacterium]|jgi:RNA polymerase sigma-70 factor (ECF subfamily)
MADRASFEAAADECRSRIYRAACLLLDDPCEAEDVTQQVFLEAWRGWDGFAERASAFTWMYRILLRVSARHRRRLWWRFWRPQSLPHEGAELITDAGPGVADDERQALRTLLRELSPKLREVLVLRYVEELSVSEMADTLRIPQGTVKSRIHYALQVASRRWKEEVNDGR